MGRNTKRKRNRRKRLLRWFLIILLLISATVGYAVFQYYQGLKDAGNIHIGDKNYDDKFRGKVDKDGNINVLLLGVDSRNEENSRTDTIMVAQYNPKEHKAKIISIMRDIYAEIPGYQNYKINTAFFLGGPELLRQTIKQNFNLDVQYYAIVDFNGFTKIVDTLSPDGIEINVEKQMSEKIGVTLEPGLQKLNGKELLGYARFRHDAEGDFGRVRRQQEVINALKDELISINGITKIPKLVGTITPFVDTSMDTMDIMALTKDFILNPPKDIETLRIPIENSYSNATYEHAGAVLELDFDANIQAIQDFLAGEEQVDIDNPENNDVTTEYEDNN